MSELFVGWLPTVVEPDLDGEVDTRQARAQLCHEVSRNLARETRLGDDLARGEIVKHRSVEADGGRADLLHAHDGRDMAWRTPRHE